MDSGKLLGLLIIIAMIISVITVGGNTLTNKMENNENIVQTTYVLDESELNKVFTENNSEQIETVNININQKLGGTVIKFIDNTTTIYNITSDNNETNKTTVTTNRTGNQLDVNINSEQSENVIILSNKYVYKINGNIYTGGFSADLANNTQVDEINFNITAGGLNLELNGGKLNTLNSQITTGGLNIIGQPNGVTTIYSTIQLGGLNLQADKAIAYIFSDIEMGGINPGDYQQVSKNEYKGKLFDSSDDKLIIYNNIGLGGINTQSF